MPWPKDHKRATRERIVEAASRAFRKRGITEVSVGDVMERAGLTHGGFYAHFDSKDALLAEAVAHAGAQARERTAKASDLLTLATMYLSEEHLRDSEGSCPIAALGPELSRSDPHVRRALAAEIRTRLAGLRELAGNERHVAGVLACMVGGLIIARALSPSDAKLFLQECRAFLEEKLA
jgi:TetR/AcrR family transcriptional regulator, transcriptional repressor for nem operon